MANLKNGRKFSAEFNKATEVNRQTRLLAQTPNEPVEYVDLEQVAEVVNEGMATQADLNTTNENVATNAGNIQTLQNEVDNRYTKEQTDAQISEAINEVEQTIEEIEQTNKETYATKTGEYKELTAGFAYEILGDSQATAEKFSFRPTGGPNRNVRDGSARIEMLKGNSVVWNQKWSSSEPSINKAGLTITINNGIYTIVGDGTSTEATITSPAIGRLTPNNKYALIGIPNSATLTSACIVSGNNGYKYAQNTIITASNHGFFYIRVEAGFNGEIIFRPKLIDLTQMYDKEIANTINTVEQFYELLPKVVDINAFNTGEIVDANYKAIKTTGFNQYNGTYAKVLGGVKYYLGGTYTSIGYTTEKGGTTEAITLPTSTERVGTTPSDRLYTPSQDGYIYAEGNNICINIMWDEYSALNGTYKPYKPFERDLSWVNKYFPATINGETKYGMRRAGNVADEIRFNSTTQQWEAVQRVGVVDLGSLKWEYYAPTETYPYGFFVTTSLANRHKGELNITSSKYVTYANFAIDKSTFGNTQGNGFYIVDSAYTDAATFKAAMAGVMLNYELTTPDVQTITEDVNLAYDVADYGTEQLLVAEGAQSAPLSAEVVYEPNVLASIKQVAAMLTRLDALEVAVATMQASAVATTNEE